MAIAPFVSWRTMTSRELWLRISSVMSLSAGLTGFLMLALTNNQIGVHLQGGETARMPFGGHVPLVPWMAFLLFCCVFAGIANAWRAIETSKRSSSSLGAFVAHLGFATLMAGLIVSRGFEQKASDYVYAGAPANLLGYTVAYKSLSGTSLEDRNGKVVFDVTSPDGSHFEARPGLYYYDKGEGQEPGVQTWPHVQKYLSHDVYLSLHPPVVKVWDNPLTLTPGTTQTIDKFQVTYMSPTSEGPLGQPGAKFGAKIHITTPDGAYDVHPTVQVTDSGLDKPLVAVGDNFLMYMDRMDAADHSVAVQLLFRRPLYPIDLFYKPLTGLVWLGAGLLFIGGGFSAAARRVRQPVTASAPAETGSEKGRKASGGLTVDPA